MPHRDEGSVRWSVLVPAYNCARYLHESLGGVLAQDPGPEAMQIVVVDDCSTDDCEDTVCALGGDRVGYVRQRHNVGLVRNLNTCLSLARGDLVHILHADDAVLDGFYRSMESLFTDDLDTAAAFCRVVYRDERTNAESTGAAIQDGAGRLSNALASILVSGPPTSAVVVRRRVYEEVGGFDSRFTRSCEDWEMWVRIATRYSIGYEPCPLAKYRYMRTGSLTASHCADGGYAADLVLAHRIVESYAPSSHRRLLAEARNSSAEWILSEAALPLAREGRIGPSMRNAWHALRCSPTRKHFRGALECLTTAMAPRMFPGS